MAKTLNEIARDLRETIIDFQSDAHNASSIHTPRYNNLKLTMDIAGNPKPHVIINIAISEAIFNIKTGEKETGSLGPDERYVVRWMNKNGTLPDLQAVWAKLEKERGKAHVEEDL